ncbi:hypothetical protein MHYP_G00137770 [Metynnis hypsauchen]
MTTARYRPTWDLALDPLVSCKLCLGEFPLEQMTTITQCQCVFCTLCLKQYVELLIKEGLETAISCPDSACPKRGHLQENEIECMVASEIMQRYRKLQFEKEVLLDPCRTWCPSSSCQAVCQLKEADATPATAGTLWQLHPGVLLSLQGQLAPRPRLPGKSPNYRIPARGDQFFLQE